MELQGRRDPGMDIAAENALGGIAVTAKGNSGGGGQAGPAGARDGGADDAEEADDLSRPTP